MVRFGKAGFGFGLGRDGTTDPYDGTGIWFRCGTSGTLRPVDQTAAFRHLVEAQCREIGESSQRILRDLGIDDPATRWEVTPGQARFTFTRPDGRRCHARYGVVGSWNPETHSWLWAWDFPTSWMPAPALRLARTLHAEGTARGWQALTEPVLYLDEHEAWHMARLAAHVAGYPLVHSARVNEKNRHFFAIDRPVWLT